MANATTLCLNNGRFSVRTVWTTGSGTGSGQAVALTGDTGYFWFFSPNNVEMVTKVVTGCPVNNRYWVFAGGLTNVNVVMTVTDTQTGTVRTYVNPQGIAVPAHPGHQRLRLSLRSDAAADRRPRSRRHGRSAPALPRCSYRLGRSVS